MVVCLIHCCFCCRWHFSHISFYCRSFIIPVASCVCAKLKYIFFYLEWNEFHFRQNFLFMNQLHLQMNKWVSWLNVRRNAQKSNTIYNKILRDCALSDWFIKRINIVQHRTFYAFYQKKKNHYDDWKYKRNPQVKMGIQINKKQIKTIFTFIYF